MLETGQIVWAKFIDPQGNLVDPHPAVVISSQEDINAGRPIRVVVISTKLDRAPKEFMVELPALRGRGGHPVTKLKEKCAAICNWVREVQQEHIEVRGGKVYGQLLERILNLVADLEA